MTRSGTLAIWLTASTLVLSVGMLVVMLALILANGLPEFWPHGLTELELKDGTRWLGEVQGEERSRAGELERLRLKVGNRDVYGFDFKWIEMADVVARREPAAALAFERLEYGYFYGYADVAQPELVAGIREATKLRQERTALNREVDRIQVPLSRAKEALARAERSGRNVADLGVMRDDLAGLDRDAEARCAEPRRRLAELGELIAKKTVAVRVADGSNHDLSLAMIERAYRPNAMSLGAKAGSYASEAWQFLKDDPRESNTEGGVFPAMFGTVMMVLVMTVAVVPFGVLAAIYMHEYARPGRFLRLVRLAVSNLAGVPSIVFGLFGLGFFVYFVGGTFDRTFFAHRLPDPTLGTGGMLWAALTLALLTLPSVVVATEEGLASVPRANRDGALALGSTKLQMISRVVIPQAMPGILTGAILAVSRGAGEVAPLMITGVVKLAKDLPFSSQFPFVHLERKFMHLGFHVYDVSMQSPNIEAAKPMVYATTLLLILIVLFLNSGAILLRNRLRARYRGSAL